ncbi:hypothetical protein FB567DRAFT_268280 [Paraphoma chrysanthemicola]|uniref:Uncharacterized protein n=1 Tax=Paraphoma chrysanthemicola TaxID=798071 RepID=A0A8K0RBL4_9PLEO|nr:hypothetical protein FB567DRAFT_268280 [Paraphoma chrysanthemicola]
MTACTGSATTVTTTTQTTTTIADVCEPSSCGRACAVKRGGRVIQTAVPYPEAATLGESSDSNDTLVLSGRDIRGPGSGNWQDFYDDVKAASGTTLIKNDQADGMVSAWTAVARVRWAGPSAIVVEELTGCIAILCYSRVGKSHACWGSMLRKMQLLVRGFCPSMY